MNDELFSLARELTEVGRLTEDDDVSSVCKRLVSRAVRTIPGCHHVTITVGVGDDKLETVAGGEVAPLSHSPAEAQPWPGPILDVVRYREPRRVDDVTIEQRWQGFPERMQQAGFRSCMALPMLAQRHPFVGFTLFSRHPHQFSDHALDLGLLFALHAGTAFDNVSLYRDSRQLVDHLHTALAAHADIGQAKGVLMHRMSWDADTAFDVLRRFSQHHNVKLRKVAADIVQAQEAGTLDSALSRWLVGIGLGKATEATRSAFRPR